MAHKIVAIPTSVVDAARSTMKSPGYGHPAHIEVATGHGPCRHCLRNFEVGRERRLLFTYDPFHGIETLPLPGPVFVHADECARCLEEGDFPTDLSDHDLTVNAYGRGRKLRIQRYVTGRDAGPTVDELLAREDVDYLHVHDTEAGCFDLRIE